MQTSGARSAGLGLQQRSLASTDGRKARASSASLCLTRWQNHRSPKQAIRQPRCATSPSSPLVARRSAIYATKSTTGMRVGASRARDLALPETSVKRDAPQSAHADALPPDGRGTAVRAAGCWNKIHPWSPSLLASSGRAQPPKEDGVSRSAGPHFGKQPRWALEITCDAVPTGAHVVPKRLREMRGAALRRRAHVGND